MADKQQQAKVGKHRGKRHTPRNWLLPGGFWRYGRCAMYRRRGNYLKKNLNTEKKVEKRTYFKIKPVGGEKNGGKRMILLKKSRKWLPSEDTPRKLRRRTKPRPCRLRKSITPGTVLILLVGRHAGKRVIFLKQLGSGLLLVTGPYGLNRVPLRRVNQAFVIATQTKVDVSGVTLPARLNDEYFKRKRLVTKKGGKKSSIFEDKENRYKVTSERKEDQKAVDKQLSKVIGKEECLKSYLRHKFSLSHGQYPHKMVF
ncbi:PREDICTED: 60S ribosomal protein L6-like isoform X2 [Amphimedon queenslandica]|nr:PREDICTED: 60S ribosomal protein L6-like isoform X2 [Amphimedon queenslandica]|eukprot:XP_003385849.1 PREDICTED: 60S ribosomal protein L6-like isoform X2 [Amphimedon queenslandica]